MGKLNSGVVPFVKDISKYFMDFLETDFHKRRNPKRSIKYRNSNNLLIGLSLGKYPTFNSLVWKAVQHEFKGDVLNKVRKGVYRTSIPNNLKDLINLQIEKISKKEIKNIIELISEDIEKFSVLHKKEYDVALNNSIEAVSVILKKDLALPFISNIEKPIENLKLGDVNNLFLMEEELAAVLVSNLESKISEVLKLLISKEKVNIKKQLSSVFDIEDVRVDIATFFENFQVGDLFSEFYEMDRNKAILDKQEFYLYFCDITFSGAKYPIFYIPFSTDRKGDSLEIEFDSQVYINKKALEYISQEYNRERGKHGSLKEISERILYLSQHQGSFSAKIQSIIDEITHFFDLDKSIVLTDSSNQLSRSLLVGISNSCYISLFDKSDEALVNDYEEILELLDQEDSELAEAFETLVDDFINNNPDPINPEVENDWDNTEVSDKLVFSSPVPLNSEQLQVLNAIKKDKCKYIIVEGPPGTGKSHTITAIVFDSILKGNSVLVLSDKKEALDVVEDKITDTMNRVRYDKNFQNPILRLGKTGNTYSKILATSTIDNVKTHYRAVKKDHELLETNIDKISNSLKEDLEAEIFSNKEVSIAEVKELVDLESYFIDKPPLVDLDEVMSDENSTQDLDEVRSVINEARGELFSLEENKNTPKIFKLLKVNLEKISKFNSFSEYVELAKSLAIYYQKIKKINGSDLDLFSIFDSFSKKKSSRLSEYVDMYEKNKHWLIGYMFNKKQVEEIDRLLRSDFSLDRSFIGHEKLGDFKKILNIVDSINSVELPDDSMSENFDYFDFIHQCCVDEEILDSVILVGEIQEKLQAIYKHQESYPNTFENLEIGDLSFSDLFNNKLIKLSDQDFDKLVRYIYLSQKISKDFKDIEEGNYSTQMKQLEELVTAQMTYLMDGRLINFYENNRATAITLRNIIRSKQRFPKDEFLKLKQAFPCILAGIRDYAEYIPLEPGMFDLLIIDEASQVSVAQAFPALLRAKKVLILGDKKQFSNVKSAQAKSDTNREYLNSVRNSFKKHISKDESRLVKLEKFNIKTSILEFFEFISNYRTQLRKHFRGYKEIISYSNKYFYQDDLQVMKIRGKRIDDVLKFSILKHDGKEELLKNTNLLEVDFIIKELLKLKEQNSLSSVGIITPHTNQQKVLVEAINKVPERDYFFDKMKLKIMTFDTCQGEERDIIFYSMVATKENDRLWGVFIKDLSSVDIEEDGKIKAQRLNVGFSRAKECMHFVLSKPVNEYNGSIGDALRHYAFTYEEAKKEKSVEQTDSRSKMEPEVLNWFYQTDFWKNNKDRINFDPQFELGKYLKQLDKLYTHPEYKVDFLLVYVDEHDHEHKIIIEYDGFTEHFKNAEGINNLNYNDYYSKDDMYRQKVLEGYGYKFIRINKFNIGENPILNLNNRIEEILTAPKPSNGFLDNIHNTVTHLNNGEMKECPKCKEIKNIEDFKDSSLITGYGRFCRQCKSKKYTVDSSKPKPILTHENCPRCNSKMILRNGKYGKFYGCSRFPYCRGTKKYN